ncbi:PREDICTED: general odorant-binding protein lush isoform X3 [Rhagoletis zephyria]|uniref:general odorant-binding protein lush isoform X3 n=1 Tax=Rhagoletis zephyria TaxID=28612 RepID=UPI0008118504|nr:PREDICTED: general odorant-binding protein lush isoform X3 [Rhagoletis zephyria]
MLFGLNIIRNFLPLLACIIGVSAVTMQQFETSLDMMRNGCAPKFKIPVELLDRLRDGDFVENNSELKCYTRCVAQLAGTLTKKGDFSVQKALAQIPIILPPEMQDTAREAMNACKEVRKKKLQGIVRACFLHNEMRA